MIRKRSDSEAFLKQIRAVSRLGGSLRKARRDAGLSQSALAASAGTSERSAWQAEAGQGRLQLYLAFAGLVGCQIAGRSLPAAEHLGARLLALRKRVRVSRRSLACTAGVSATTLASLEAGELGHLSVLERVGDALGAGLALVPVEGASFYSMAALSSAWDAWASPADFLEKLYTVIAAAEFDLDPCSPGRHRSRVRARSHFDETDNGLAHPWKGSIYMNPPYGREIAHWTAKALLEVGSGRAKFVIGLLPARTDTAWWHRDIARHADIWFLNGRLAFGDGAQPSPFASAITFWGATDGHRASMCAAFPRAWHVAARPQPSNGVKPTRHRKSLRSSAGASGTSTLQAADVQAPMGVRS